MLASDPGSTPDFVSLSELLGGSDSRIRCVLRAFCSTAGEELVRLEAALREGDAQRISEAAHRAATDCFVVGEIHAGQTLEAIAASVAASSPEAPLVGHVVRARAALLQSIARVTSCLVASADSDIAARPDDAGREPPQPV